MVEKEPTVVCWRRPRSVLLLLAILAISVLGIFYKMVSSPSAISTTFRPPPFKGIAPGDFRPKKTAPSTPPPAGQKEFYARECTRMRTTELEQFRFLLTHHFKVSPGDGNIYDFSALTQQTTDEIVSLTRWKGFESSEEILNVLPEYEYTVTRMHDDLADGVDSNPNTNDVLLFRLEERYMDLPTEGGSTFKVNASSPRTAALCSISDCFNGTYHVLCENSSLVESVSFVLMYINFTAFVPYGWDIHIEVGLYKNPQYQEDLIDHLHQPECHINYHTHISGLWVHPTNASWSWYNRYCLLQTLQWSKIKNILGENPVVFIGDSFMRYRFLYTALRLNTSWDKNIDRKLNRQVSLGVVTYIPAKYPADLPKALKQAERKIKSELDRRVWGNDGVENVTIGRAIMDKGKNSGIHSVRTARKDPGSKRHRIQRKHDSLTRYGSVVKTGVILLAIGHWTLYKRDLIMYFYQMQESLKALKALLHDPAVRVVWLGCPSYPDTNVQHRGRLRTNAALAAINQYTAQQMAVLDVTYVDVMTLTSPRMYDTADDMHYVTVDPKRGIATIRDVGKAVVNLLNQFILYIIDPFIR